MRRALAIVFFCGLFVLPLVFMFVGSLRTPGLPPPDGFEWLPDPLRWLNYRDVQGFVDIWAYMKNSVIVVLIAVPLTVLVASWAGFAIATAAPRMQRILISVSLIGLMVPVGALWIPRFVLFKWLGLTDTLVPLIAPALMGTTPFYVLVFALVYSRIPKSLFEAARLEGMSPIAIWRRVAFPLGKPAAFAVGVLALAWHWANFIDPLIFLSSEKHYTLPLGLRALQSLEATNHPILLAGAVLATLPPVLAFLLVQRTFFTKTLEV
jgi:multiple sugar transport system permease protein